MLGAAGRVAAVVVGSVVDDVDVDGLVVDAEVELVVVALACFERCVHAPRTTHDHERAEPTSPNALVSSCASRFLSVVSRCPPLRRRTGTDGLPKRQTVPVS